MADEMEIQATEQAEIKEQDLFVFRLVSAECCFGSMQHPLNVAEAAGGHGVLYGAEEQPLLNANDWLPDINVIHFGDCSPKKLDENGDVIKTKGLEHVWENITSFVNTGKCKPLIEKVWYDTDKKYLIDGAPVLLVRSMLFCRRGGVIKIVWQKPGEEEGSTPQTAEEAEAEAQAAIEQAQAEVDAAADQALAEGKIDQETADYLKEAYKAALIFSNGDIEEANKLFNDLLRYGNSPAFGMDPAVDYENSGAINEKFILYLKHTQSPLLSDCNSTMNLTNTITGEQVNLRDAGQAIASNNKRIEDTLTYSSLDEESKKNQATMSGYLEQQRKEAAAKYTIIDPTTGMEYSMTLPGSLTDPDPDKPFAFMPDGTPPSWYTNSNINATTTTIIDEAASNPGTPVVVSILNGLS